MKTGLSANDPIAVVHKLRHPKLMRLASAFLACAVAVVSTTALAAPDPRAQDAADAFSQLCVSMFVGGESDADPQRFVVTKLDEATRKQIKPDIKASTLWDVHAKGSDASMLVHYEPSGICVVEIAEAEEASVQRAVAQAAADAASSLDTTATTQVGETRQVGGLTATTSSWRFTSKGGEVLIMLTTLPESKFMIQHVLTASYVR